MKESRQIKTSTEIIQTKSFKLAVYHQGSLDASRLALLLPGRLDTKDYPHMRSHVDFLASKGYLAVSFDPPGTWESPGDISLYTMTNYLAAINELIEHFGSKSTVLIGHSRGGTMAMLAGCRNKYVTHIVNIFGKAHTHAIPEAMKPGDSEEDGRDLPGDPTQFKIYKLPYEFFADATKYDTYAEVVTCTKPKLFISGLHDTFAPPETMSEMYNISVEPKKLVTLDCDHDYRLRPEMIERVNDTISQFLKEYN